MNWFVELWVGATGYLALIYLALALISIFQLFRIYINRYLLISYQGGFLVLTLLWSIFRVFFLISFNSNWPRTIFLTLYWIPLCVQMATFSLFLLFYVETVHLEKWDRIGIFVEMLYISVNLLYVIVIAANIMVDGLISSTTVGSSAIWDPIRLVCSGLIFFVIAILFLVYGILVSRTDSVAARAMRFGKGFRGRVLTTTILLFLVFTSRCVFDVLTVSHAISVALDNRGWGGLFLFVFFFVWEIFPAVLIIFVFRRIPSSRQKRLAMLFSCGRRGRGGSGEGYDEETTAFVYPTMDSGDTLVIPNFSGQAFPVSGEPIEDGDEDRLVDFAAQTAYEWEHAPAHPGRLAFVRDSTDDGEDE